MLLILNDYSEYDAHTLGKKGVFGKEKQNPICDCSRSNQLPKTDELMDTCAPSSECPT